MYFESGGGGALRETDIDCYVQAVLRLLEVIGVTEPGTAPLSAADPKPEREPERERERAAAASKSQVVVTGGDGDTDTGVLFTAPGAFVSSVSAGEAVTAGQSIGTVYDEGGRAIEVVRAVSPGIVMMLRHDLRVTPGDVAAIVAGEDGGVA